MKKIILTSASILSCLFCTCIQNVDATSTTSMFYDQRQKNEKNSTLDSDYSIISHASTPNVSFSGLQRQSSNLQLDGKAEKRAQKLAKAKQDFQQTFKNLLGNDDYTKICNINDSDKFWKAITKRTEIARQDKNNSPEAKKLYKTYKEFISRHFTAKNKTDSSKSSTSFNSSDLNASTNNDIQKAMSANSDVSIMSFSELTKDYELKNIGWQTKFHNAFVGKFKSELIKEITSLPQNSAMQRLKQIADGISNNDTASSLQNIEQYFMPHFFNANFNGISEKALKNKIAQFVSKINDFINDGRSNDSNQIRTNENSQHSSAIGENENNLSSISDMYSSSYKHEESTHELKTLTFGEDTKSTIEWRHGEMSNYAPINKLDDIINKNMIKNIYLFLEKNEQHLSYEQKNNIQTVLQDLETSINKLNDHREIPENIRSLKSIIKIYNRFCNDHNKHVKDSIQKVLDEKLINLDHIDEKLLEKLEAKELANLLRSLKDKAIRSKELLEQCAQQANEHANSIKIEKEIITSLQTAGDEIKQALDHLHDHRHFSGESKVLFQNLYREIASEKTQVHANTNPVDAFTILARSTENIINKYNEIVDLTETHNSTVNASNGDLNDNLKEIEHSISDAIKVEIVESLIHEILFRLNKIKEHLSGTRAEQQADSTINSITKIQMAYSETLSANDKIAKLNGAVASYNTLIAHLNDQKVIANQLHPLQKIDSVANILSKAVSRGGADSNVLRGSSVPESSSREETSTARANTATNRTMRKRVNVKKRKETINASDYANILMQQQVRGRR